MRAGYAIPPQQLTDPNVLASVIPTGGRDPTPQNDSLCSNRKDFYHRKLGTVRPQPGTGIHKNEELKKVHLAVGTPVTGRAPHRPGRAVFPHPVRRFTRLSSKCDRLMHTPNIADAVLLFAGRSLQVA